MARVAQAEREWRVGAVLAARCKLASVDPGMAHAMRNCSTPRTQPAAQPWAMPLSVAAMPALTHEQVQVVLTTIISRLLMMLLTRRGLLVEDMGQTCPAEPDVDADEARTLQPLQAAAITYHIAFDPRAWHKVLTLRDAMPREAAPRQPLCADIDGFSLHSAVRGDATDRKRLELLCRYIARTALSDEPVQCNAAGQVELELNTPCPTAPHTPGDVAAGVGSAPALPTRSN